jgi:uncharacterized protein (TIGR03067 family)
MSACIIKCCGGLTLFALVAASLNVWAAQERGDPALRGKWSVISMRKNGKELEEAIAGVITLEFDGEKATMLVLGKGKPIEFRTDTTKTPRWVDLKGFTHPGTSLGIYKVEKDLLTLCLTWGGEPRPEKFEAGVEHTLLVFKRGEIKPDPKGVALAIERLRAAADRAHSQNNLKQIAIAFYNYHDLNQRLPARAILSKGGQPLLSWRVQLLPHLEENDLYKQFKLDEPWDSDHNKKLLEKMPAVYAPVAGKTKEPHSTYYQVFTGPGTVFDSEKRLTFGAISAADGTSNTLLVVEAGEAVLWTKPDDLKYDPKGPLPKLGGMFQDVFHAALTDGSVRAIRRQFDADLFRLLITWNDGRLVDFDKLAP